MKLLKRTWADISMDNLSHNYRLLRSCIPADCRFLGVVKADAYGHGAVPVSRQLVDLGADYLAVSNMEEAVQLRRSYIRLPILILGYTPAFYAEDMVDMGIRQEVHSVEYAMQQAGDFSRNHTWIVYAYYAGSGNLQVESLYVKDWSTKEINHQFYNW